jgi:leucyl-tRNA synthetase
MLTINECLERYGADATRIALADAGDTLDDPNFREETANACVLKLKKLYDWVEKGFAGIEKMRTGPLEFYDQLFENCMNEAIKESEVAYE